MNVRYIVVNVGCIECGVSTEIVGVYKTKRAAEAKAKRQEDWREGGQSDTQIFEIEV